MRPFCNLTTGTLNKNDLLCILSLDNWVWHYILGNFSRKQTNLDSTKRIIKAMAGFNL
jgi:hypothetical protein